MVSHMACPRLEFHQVSLAGEGYLVASVNGLVVLRVPRLRSHYRTVFCPTQPPTKPTRSLIFTKFGIGMGHEKLEMGPLQTHTFTWWVFVS